LTRERAPFLVCFEVFRPEEFVISAEEKQEKKYGFGVKSMKKFFENK
jgi:hypothetical protein